MAYKAKEIGALSGNLNQLQLYETQSILQFLKGFPTVSLVAVRVNVRAQGPDIKFKSTCSREGPLDFFLRTIWLVRLVKPLQCLRHISAVSLRKFGASLRKFPQKTVCIMKHPNCVLSYNSRELCYHPSLITARDHLHLLPWQELSRLPVNPLVGKLPGKAGNLTC